MCRTFPGHYLRSELGSRTLDTTPQSPDASATPAAQLESWEEDLMVFLRECKPRVEDSLEKEEMFVDYPRLCEPGVEDGLKKKEARRFVERLGSVRRYVG